jgi:hypothetical protein
VVDEAEGADHRQVAMRQRSAHIDRSLSAKGHLSWQQVDRVHHSIKTHDWRSTQRQRLVERFDH